MMLTFDQATKDRYLARIAEHARFDQIVQGIGFEGGRGCAVGCTLDAYDHAAYERELGIPAALAYLEDGLHEAQTPERARLWPARFLSAVPIQRDLSTVVPRFLIWLLTEECPSKSSEKVAILYRRRLAGDEPSEQEWAASAASAASAAWAAASAANAASAASAANAANAASAANAANAAKAASTAKAAKAAWAAANAASAASAASTAKAASAAWAASTANAAKAAWAAASAANAASAASAAKAAKAASAARQADKLIELLETA